MASITADTIVDRIRSVCASSPFSFTEAETWDSFDLQPSPNIDGVFRIVPPASQSARGFFGLMAEERTDSVQIWLARERAADPNAVRKTLIRDMHSLTAAVMRDAYEQSGDYVVPDDGRGHSISAPPGKTFAVLRLTLPVNYETAL